MYTEQELKENCLEYFSGDSLASDVWIKKYALQDNDNNYLELTPNDTHKRLAKEFARIESKYLNPLSEDEIYNLFKNFKYIIPQGSPMEGIGNNYRIQSLSNCFVIEPPADSYGGILKTDQEQAQLMKRRGGVGFDISPIRPKGAKTKNAAKTTDGISIFMERFSNTTREVAQNGRRGALLISISIQHPEIETFIDIKKDLKRVTGANISIRISDAFMHAVKNDENFTLQWPVECDNPIITKEVNARKIWNKIIDAAWTSAEPGVLFWDTAKKYTPSDIYKDFGFASISTNPCIIGDTLIAVADGRNVVSIKQLTEEGKDVPVYCLNDKGKLSIKTMRHPRITGYNKPIYKIILENGHEIKVTDNHKFLLTSGEYKQTKDLQYGDSLYILTKYVASIEEIFKNSNSRSSDYWWLKNGNETNKSEHRFIYEQFSNNKIEKGNIIHHKDFNSLNNTFENLKNMSKQQHDNYHGTLIQGKNNPYYKFEHVKKAFDEAAAHVGEKNGRWLDISNEEIISYAKELTQYLQRKISWNELREYVKYTYNKIVPLYFAEYRKKELNNCLEIVALELNIDKNLIFNDFRFIKSYKYALEQYENVKNENGVILVEKICEHCKNKFWVNYDRREISFCSTQCCNYWYNKNTNTNINRTNSLNETYKQKAEKNKLNQIKIYNDIKFKHKKRQPWVEEWKEECKKNNIPHRLNTKYGFKTFDELIESANMYNHRVISIEFCGYENVYNGTVDNYHNFFCGGFEEKTKSNKCKLLFLNNLQCGEIVLSSYDSCRLMVLNTTSYVKNMFTDKSYFDYVLFSTHVIIAQRLMDDIVDLELEQIDKIIKKIKSDPEEEETKRTELLLWNKIKKSAINGRRTGLGITGLGDTIAMINLKYGTDESINEIEKIYKTLTINSEKSSVILAKERGAFPVFNLELEKNHPFLERIWNEDPILYKEYKKYGRRNIATTTTSPTGTISTMTQTTSGIEPVFMLDYTRRKKIMSDAEHIKPDYTDENGDKWQEFKVYHKGLQQWMEINQETDISKSPYWGATANEIDHMKTVDIQAVAQHWIEHSISKTANLPKNVSRELVSDLYMKAWESECKGFTIYREGSRSGVLIATDKKEEELVQHDAPKRPKELKADYYVTTAKGAKYAVIVGLWKDTNKPYEIFAFENPPMDKNTKGTIIKVEKGHYMFVNGEFKIDNIHLAAERVEERAHTLWLSMLLRTGAKIEHIVKVAKKVDENITSFSSACRRVLSRYVETEQLSEKCPECGEKLVREEGCVHCDSCTYSKCS